METKTITLHHKDKSYEIMVEYPKTFEKSVTVFIEHELKKKKLHLTKPFLTEITTSGKATISFYAYHHSEEEAIKIVAGNYIERVYFGGDLYSGKMQLTILSRFKFGELFTQQLAIDVYHTALELKDKNFLRELDKRYILDIADESEYPILYELTDDLQFLPKDIKATFLF